MATLETFEAMLARGQDSALLRFTLGGAYLKQGRVEDAIEQLNKALEQDAHYSAAWKLLGKALIQSGRLEQAMDVYRRGIAVAARKGDKQTQREMEVFLKRLVKQSNQAGEP
jgi:Tfp pilus assembly protein PilF